MTSTTRVVVIGGGMAGARLAQQLTAAPAPTAGATPVDVTTPRPAAAPTPAPAPIPTPPPTVTVTVIGEEQHPPYNRVLLAEVLAGRYAPQVIALPVPGSGVRWLGGVQAVRIDRAARRVLCDDGQEIPYDALVLATGANPVLPPLHGLFTPGRGGVPDGVHPFRTLDDCRALAAAARPGAPAVVIGGGLLGVSAARALAARGMQVVLAHQGEHLMERQLDADAAALLGRHLAALGIEVHNECRVRGIETEPQTGNPSTPPPSAPGPAAAAAAAAAPAPAPAHPPHVQAVTLADGFRLAAEVVVLACGVRPRTGLARAAGLDIGRGIRVDDALRTSDPRIHAIGDCAEHNGTVYGLAGAAQEQADAVSEFLTSPAPAEAPAPPYPPRPYTGTRTLTRLTLAAPEAIPRATQEAAPAPTSPSPSPTLDLAAFGETTPLPGDDVVRLSDATRTSYRKVVVRGDRLVGGILLGDLGSVGTLAGTWESDEALPAAPLLHLLTTDGGF